MPDLFEYSDRLNAPVEAFYCTSEKMHLPVGAHWHYFVEILYMETGSVTVVCNGLTQQLMPGDMLFIPPQTVHSISWLNDQPFRYKCIKYSPSRIRLVEDYLPNLNILFNDLMQREDPPFRFRVEDFDGISLPDQLDAIFSEVQQRKYGYLTCIYSRLTELTLQILRIWYNRGIPLQTEPITDADTYSIQNVVIYIDKYSHENLLVDDLAKMCNMSYSYFAKVFHRQYGQSCKQYIEFIRLTKAENLLLFTDHDLSAIAEETGFSDCSHLIRCFKRLYHITPKQYRLFHR